MKNTTQRVASLRKWMKEKHLKAFIIPSSDPHGSEYVPSHWKSREWISGFNGSAGTAVITMNEAALWTDSRYFLAAENCLKGTPFSLMKLGQKDVPSISQWLLKKLKKGDIAGIDGRVFCRKEAHALCSLLQKNNINLNCHYDPMDELWEDRPQMPAGTIVSHQLKFSGESAASKLKRLKNHIKAEGAEGALVCALDEIAWLFNLRGNDTQYNPVFIAYALILPQETRLYVNGSITEEAKKKIEETGILTMSYGDIQEDLKKFSKRYKLLLPENINYHLSLIAHTENCLYAPSPVCAMKAIKNKTEQEGFRQVMLRDGVIMVKLLRWISENVKDSKISELDIDQKLTALRKEDTLSHGHSFATIAAYASHGAIVHYEATKASNVSLQDHGLLLIDQGGQYDDGTSDITRTISLGEVSEEEKHIYTLVLKGHIALSQMKFPDGASGTQIDMSARNAMWKEGYNFGHGTGHGVGSYLNVHEGPQGIRQNWVEAPLHADMTITNEPGLYLTGKFGVRIENMLLTVPWKKTEFGTFLGFEILTLCPIDLRPVDFSMLNPEETNWINEYHHNVRTKLLPLLSNEKDRQYLINETKQI